jgi:hypothetical protein
MMAGASKLDVADIHHIGESTVYTAMAECLHAIDAALAFVYDPTDDAQMAEIAEGFEEGSGGVLTGCVGAIDGIQIAIAARSVPGGVAGYYCRKGFYSLNVQGICDAHNRIRWLRAAEKGASHDSTAWRSSPLAQCLDGGAMGEQWWLAADDAYAACGPYMLTPYPGRGLADTDPAADAFNYYLSNSR